MSSAKIFSLDSVLKIALSEELVGGLYKLD